MVTTSELHRGASGKFTKASVPTGLKRGPKGQFLKGSAPANPKKK